MCVYAQGGKREKFSMKFSISTYICVWSSISLLATMHTFVLFYCFHARIFVVINICNDDVNQDDEFT